MKTTVFGYVFFRPAPVIICYLLWSDVNGNEKFGEEEEKWFKKMRVAMGGERFCTDFPDKRSMAVNPIVNGMNFYTELFGVDLFMPNDGKAHVTDGLP